MQYPQGEDDAIGSKSGRNVRRDFGRKTKGHQCGRDAPRKGGRTQCEDAFIG